MYVYETLLQRVCGIQTQNTARCHMRGNEALEVVYFSGLRYCKLEMCISRRQTPSSKSHATLVKILVLRNYINSMQLGQMTDCQLNPDSCIPQGQFHTLGRYALILMHVDCCRCLAGLYRRSQLEVALELTWGYSLSCEADLVFESFASCFWREDVLLSLINFMKLFDTFLCP